MPSPRQEGRGADDPMVNETTRTRQGPLRSFYENPTPDKAHSGAERAQRQLTMLLDIVRSSPSPLRVVDVGCGDGIYTAMARDSCRQHGHPDTRVVGLDWSLAALGRARQLALPVGRASVEPPGLPLADDSQDVVVMSEFLEHLVDPDAALDEARRVLGPGGHLLVSTPNLAAWFNRALLVLGIQPVFSEVSLRGIYGRPGREVVGHLRLYTRRALVAVLEAHGFVDISVVGGRYHDVPRPLRPVDRIMCRAPAWASILIASARSPSSARSRA